MKKYSINGKQFTKSGLELWAWTRMKEAPGWEKSHLIFILQWLSRSTHVKLTSSGTTGSPKTFELPKRWMEQSAHLTEKALSLDEGTNALLCLPSVFISGKMMIVRSLCCNWNLRWTEPAGNPLVQEADGIDFVAMTPMQVQRVLEESPEAFNKIGKVLIGGGTISPSLEEQIQHCSNACYASYGMTETASHVALRRVNGDDASPMYRAVPGVKFSQDDRGCLVIQARHLDDTIIVTNDLVDLNDADSFTYKGRLDNVINSGGVKLFPEQIESKIASLIPSRFIIHKANDPGLGECAVLLMEGWPFSDEKKAALMEQMKAVLSPYEVPKRMDFILKFEETATGKIVRRNYGNEK